MLPGCLSSLSCSKWQLRMLLCDGCTSLYQLDLLDIAKLPALEHLSLAACSSIACGSLQPLSKLPRLRHLNLSSTQCLKDAAIASLALAPSLQELRVDCCANVRSVWPCHSYQSISLLLVFCNNKQNCVRSTDIQS